MIFVDPNMDLLIQWSKSWGNSRKNQTNIKHIKSTYDTVA